MKSKIIFVSDPDFVLGASIGIKNFMDKHVREFLTLCEKTLAIYLVDEKSSKEQADYLSSIDLKTADLEKEGIEKGKDPNKSDDNQEYYKAIAWDPSLLEKEQENEDSEAGGSKEKEKKKKKEKLKKMKIQNTLHVPLIQKVKPSATKCMKNTKQIAHLCQMNYSSNCHIYGKS